MLKDLLPQGVQEALSDTKDPPSKEDIDFHSTQEGDPEEL